MGAHRDEARFRVKGGREKEGAITPVWRDQQFDRDSGGPVLRLDLKLSGGDEVDGGLTVSETRIFVIPACVAIDTGPVDYRERVPTPG